MIPETAPPRDGEHPDTAALSGWLKAPVRILQFPAGHSNLTYLLSTSSGEFVLRRPPLGPLAPRAHDVAREFRLLSALHPHYPLAPRPFRLCEDPTVLGCPFFLMERRHGVILRDQAPPEADRPAISRAFVETLADLHSVDTSDPAIAALGRPSGFLVRQVQGWRDRWERAAPAGAPEIDLAMAWLAGHVPTSDDVAVIHNDFKLDNLMLDAVAPGRVAAVLDWEMATLGDPLFDLGVALTYWSHAPSLGLTTTPPGWWSRDEIVHTYGLRTGRNLRSLAWHELFGVCKLAVIVRQIHVRWQRGQTTDQRFSRFGEMVEELGAIAARLREHLT
ncbi:MAG TPA: phosphotransferase family protein [Paludibaculum sp.]|jgi:aminoglycoside phosphotransferase (APT) family kinase protein